MAAFYLWNGAGSIYRVMESVFFIGKRCMDMVKSLVTGWVGLVGRTRLFGTCAQNGLTQGGQSQGAMV